MISLRRFYRDGFSEWKDAFRNGRIGNQDVLVVRNGYNILKNHLLSGTFYAFINVDRYVLLLLMTYIWMLVRYSLFVDSKT